MLCQLCQHNFKHQAEVYVLLEYFVTGVCFIRVVQWSSVYKSMGFIYPNKFIYLKLFLGAQYRGAWITEDALYNALEDFYFFFGWLSE